MTNRAATIALAPLIQDHIQTIAAIESEVALMPWSFDLFSQCLRDDYCNHVLLANNKPVGFSICSIGAGEAHLQNIAIAASEQGQGWGRWLLQQTVGVLQTKAVQRLFLEVRASNQPAIRLYETFGFEYVGLRRDYYPAPVGREDGHVFLLELSRIAG